MNRTLGARRDHIASQPGGWALLLGNECLGQALQEALWRTLSSEWRAVYSQLFSVWCSMDGPAGKAGSRTCNGRTVGPHRLPAGWLRCVLGYICLGQALKEALQRTLSSE